jgi:uncharacterized membrane protein YtjA (UPF0391 family)
MLRWAFIFFLIAISTGVAAFIGPAADTATIVQLLFFVFVVLFVVFLLLGVTRANKLDLGRGRG